ncbi:uncharacterized protein ACR2FA_010770 [Aphomia sociella]
MSGSNSSEPKPLVIKKISRFPSIILRNNKVTVIKNENGDIIKNIKGFKPLKQLYREDLIYESKPGDFLKSTDLITITNLHNLTTNSVRTVAKYVSRDGTNTYVKTSDNIVKVIGQDHYDILFSALCSVLNLEIKVRGILALLTIVKAVQEAACQTDASGVTHKGVSTLSTGTQTNESSMDILLKQRQRKRVKRQHLTPYVVKDIPDVPEKMVKKIIINPENFHQFQSEDGDDSVSSDRYNKKEQLPMIHLDEDSNGSIGNLSSLSVNTIPQLLDNPTSLLNNIERHTASDTVSEISKENIVYSPTMLTLIDGTQITIPLKPEDHFHIATPDILKHVSAEHRRKLLFLQAYLDWKHCTDKDEDGYMAIHLAAQNGDVDLIRRQCLVLKSRQESVDVTAGNMTALQLSLYQPSAQCTAMLLRFGADPLMTDSENRTCLHLAAEEKSDHLRAIINYCQSDPMRILRENEEFWNPELENKPKDELVWYLFDKLSKMNDSQGHTPLMLASKIGNYEAVKALVDMAPSSVNLQMPNCGNTALFLAVGAACIDSTERGNMTKVADNFIHTIEILVENGADPAIDNYSGVNVNVLLTEFNISELSLLIANKLTSINCFKGSWPEMKHNDTYILVKDKEGNVNVKEMSREKEKRKDMKPKILENVRVDTKFSPIKDTNKIGVVINKVIDSQHSNTDSNFMNTFKRFLKNNDDVIDTTNIPITVEHTFVNKINSIRRETDSQTLKLVKRNALIRKAGASKVVTANSSLNKQTIEAHNLINSSQDLKDSSFDGKIGKSRKRSSIVLEPTPGTSTQGMPEIIIRKKMPEDQPAKKSHVMIAIDNSKRFETTIDN